tara:strand:- start:4730 stop:5821 length:1092 start_codon:yes stop_codon:yes gene_type:complete
MNMNELENIDISKVSNFNFKIPHRNWKQAFARAFVLMTTTNPGEVISIVGPTRAGKTELLNQLEIAICGTSQFTEGEQPFVSIELVNDDRDASFSFKSLILQALETLRHPFYSSASADGWGDPKAEVRIERAREKTLNRALVRALILRRTRFLVIDEAQHVRYAGKDTRAAVGVMDALKTMAKKANVVLVIAGTYPILDAFNRSSHLEARKYDIHLSRYRHNDEDLAEFQWILAHYDARIDLDESLPSLLECTGSIYRATFGCIGLVRALLYDASTLAAVKRMKVDLNIIEEVMKSPRQLHSVAEEILIGESTLGIEPCPVLSSAVGFCGPKPKAKNNTLQSSSSSAKPFQRKAKRFEPGNRV